MKQQEAPNRASTKSDFNGASRDQAFFFVFRVLLILFVSHFKGKMKHDEISIFRNNEEKRISHDANGRC